jgi:sulfur-oxidizing protein SoxA
MKLYIYFTMTILCCSLFVSKSYADPKTDNETIRSYFQDIFPNLALDEYVNGVYAIDENSRSQWLEIEEFPPYEAAIEKGETLFTIPFTNGKSYADCFENKGVAIKQNYPYFDTDKGQVVTLELAINECRQKNGEQALKYGKGDIAYISSYMAFTSRDKKINITIPDDPRAKEAYDAGKMFFYSRRGQLNMACATCHMANAGKRLRADTLSPALGQVSHFPAFRFKWDDVGTLQRRYAGCNTQIRSKPFKLQSEQYRNLEYFHTYMSNGLPINGPGSRK